MDFRYIDLLFFLGWFPDPSQTVRKGAQLIFEIGKQHSRKHSNHVRDHVCLPQPSSCKDSAAASLKGKTAWPQQFDSGEQWRSLILLIQGSVLEKSFAFEQFDLFPTEEIKSIEHALHFRSNFNFQFAMQHPKPSIMRS